MGRALFKLANKIGDKKTILQIKAERKMIQTVNDNYYKQRTIIEQQLEIQQKNQALEQKDQALISSAKAMLKSGMSIEQVQEITKFPLELLKKLQN